VTHARLRAQSVATDIRAGDYEMVLINLLYAPKDRSTRPRHARCHSVI
jgi:hypothetical protein